jgi:hypothetical protein
VRRAVLDLKSSLTVGRRPPAPSGWPEPAAQAPQDLSPFAIRFTVVARFRIPAIALACLLLAACGGTAKQASIRQPAAGRLANESDGVAAALRVGDTCLAATRARALRSQVAAAISAGSIPDPLAADARAASTRLVSQISCVQPPPPRPAATPPAAVAPTCGDVHDRGKKHGDAQDEQEDRGKHGHHRPRKECK